MNREFSTLDIVKLMGIPRERLRVWMDKGYIRPSIQTADKQGEKNLFSRIDLYVIALFRYFVDKGFAREKAAILIDSFYAEIKNLQRDRIAEKAIDTTSFIYFITRIIDGESHAECWLDTPEKQVFTQGSRAHEWIREESFADFFTINFLPLKSEIDSAIK